MVDAARDFGRVWYGIESDAGAVCTFERALLGDTGQPTGVGLCRAENDDEPVSCAAQDVVCAAVFGDGGVVVRGSAQRGRGAVALTRFDNKENQKRPGE